MKTPEQIAQSIADDWTRLDGEHKEDVIEAMIEAIEADRAQRKVVNWDEAGQLVQAYHEAADSWSGIDRSVAAMEIVNWVEYALEGGTR